MNKNGQGAYPFLTKKEKKRIKKRMSILFIIIHFIFILKMNQTDQMEKLSDFRPYYFIYFKNQNR